MLAYFVVVLAITSAVFAADNNNNNNVNHNNAVPQDVRLARLQQGAQFADIIGTGFALRGERLPEELKTQAHSAFSRLEKGMQKEVDQLFVQHGHGRGRGQ